MDAISHLKDTQHTQVAEKVDIMRIEDLIGVMAEVGETTIQVVEDITDDLEFNF